MKDYRAASRYAHALMALAEKGSLIDRIEKELGEGADLVSRYPEVSHLLANATVSREEKEDFIEKILPAGSSALIRNFFKVLVKKRRFGDLILIREAFHRLYEEKKGLQKVRVESPIALDAALQERLRLALEKKLKRTVYLETTVNPGLLGGLVLDFDGTRLDGSFRTFLHELKQRLVTPYAET